MEEARVNGFMLGTFEDGGEERFQIHDRNPL